jgi:hypothetical protein
MVAYAAESQPAKPTHGGTASMPTMGETKIKKIESPQSGKVNRSKSTKRR